MERQPEPPFLLIKNKDVKIERLFRNSKTSLVRVMQTIHITKSTDLEIIEEVEEHRQEKQQLEWLLVQ